MFRDPITIYNELRERGYSVTESYFGMIAATFPASPVRGASVDTVANSIDVQYAVSRGEVSPLSEAAQIASDFMSTVRWFAIAATIVAITVLAALLIGTFILVRYWFRQTDLESLTKVLGVAA